MDLLLITDENRSHDVYIKDSNRFIYNKPKYENKKHFCRYCFQCFSGKRILVEHKEVCLKINGEESVKLRDGSNKFKNYSKQLAVSFKTYADLESVLRIL